MKKRRGSAVRLFAGVLITLALIVGFAFVGNSLFMPLLTRRLTEVVVPEVIGMSRDEAERLLLKSGFAIGSIREVRHQTYPPGQVVAQYPRPGRKAKRGRPVDLEVSTGAAQVTVPRVEGLPVASAIFVLEQSGLAVARIESLRTPRLLPSQVVSVKPPVGSEVPPGTEVVISISTRAGAFQMPALVGMDIEAAEGIIASQGLILGEIQTAISAEPVGRVLVQYPEEGMPVVEGDTVTLIVSGHRR
ncbi:MAG: PASTA domain-containing protein [candidate division WOR-3 bacterium]